MITGKRLGYIRFQVSNIRLYTYEGSVYQSGHFVANIFCGFHHKCVCDPMCIAEKIEL